QAPSGLGYTIENRLTMNTVANELYPNIFTKKLYPFIEDFKELLNKLTDGDISTAALLTPGPHNETYFEHAYLSSFLEIDLVQGDDLLSKNGSVWLKSLSGLKKINTLLRRVDDRFCDPLELNDESKLGVAGLVESMRQDNLSMINPIGSAILENVGLNPFMEKIAEYFLQEKLILPQIATWWCGQQKELDFVLENLEKLIIKKIDRTQVIQVFFWNKLSLAEREELRELLIKNPNQYVAQEAIGFSTVPYYAKGKIEPRNAVIRTFCLKKDDDYSVMDGGLVRVSASKDSLLVSSQKGGTSKDLWILGTKDDDITVNAPFKYAQYVETSINKIPTPKAENLFWLGRYLARSIATTRVIIHVIKKITNFYRYEVATSKESLEILQKALTHMTMTYPGFLDTKNNALKIFPMEEITSVIKDSSRVGSLSFTFSMLSNANMNLKDILAFESSKLFEKMQKEFGEFTGRKRDSTLVVANEMDSFLVYLMAYKELVKESIFKEQGLILYDIGYKIEVALLLISKSRSMLCLKLDRFIGHDVLEGMLNSLESFNAYRAHYRTSLTLENTVDFLILNPQFPKSLTHITKKLLKEFKQLPKAKEYLTSYEKPIAEAQELLKSIDIKTLMQIKDEDGVYTKFDEILSTLSELYLECSNEFSNTYFSHYDE
ncbi:circularly permuted type 2 ATP-grasp protein, partial [bacterium]|nr:circularly permuted type 2 ATP-grasp protein [bacterium]